MGSLKIKLTSIYSIIGVTSLLLMLMFFYSASTTSIYKSAESRAETLSDEIIYSLEILVAQNDTFAIQRLVERSSTLEGVDEIIVVDTQQKVLAHTNKQMVGTTTDIPLLDQAIHQQRKASVSGNERIIYVSPMRGQTFSNEYLNVNGALLVEINVSPAVAELRQTFGLVALTSIIILLIFYMAQYFTVKKIIIDRLFGVEAGIARSMQDNLSSMVRVDTSFGSEDEINALAQTYNYLISKLRDSQKKLKNERDFALKIMESMGEGLTITDSDGFFEYVNPAYANILRLDSMDIIGNRPEDFTFAEDRKISKDAWELRKQGKASSYEVRLLGKNPVPIKTLITSVPRIQDGKFSGSIAVVTNISERARLEQMKSDFINRASHELRTPLTTAILMADLLAGSTEQEHEKFLPILKQELNRQRLLLDDLLVAGRIENKRFKVSLVPTDILPIIEEAITSVSPQAEQRRIVIKQMGMDVLPQVNTDKQALLQVLLNLLSNAIKFSHPESKVDVITALNANSITITVKDYGIGIPAQDLPHITGRFFRAQNATELEIPGTGIGLYIIKEILEALGGHLEIESIENQGTSATAVLPIPSKAVSA